MKSISRFLFFSLFILLFLSCDLFLSLSINENTRSSSSSSSSYGPVPTTGLVAYYPFNGNANDESGTGNNGATIGPPTLTTDRFGNVNSAYYFNGSSYIDCGKDISITNITQEITVSLWVKPVQYAVRIMGRCHEDLWGGWSLYLTSDHKFYFSVNDGNGNGSDSEHNLTNQQLASLGTYYHLAGVYNNTTGTLKMYVNGTPIIRTGYTGYIEFTADVTNHSECLDLLIGRYWSGGAGNFYGTLDDVRIYNRALNDSEVLALYHEGGW